VLRLQHLGMAAFCAHRAARIDVNRSFVVEPLAVLSVFGPTLRQAAASSAIAGETRESQPLNNSRALGAGPALGFYRRFCKPSSAR
jgi:hypothetical protein